jgi:hypothetical protein
VRGRLTDFLVLFARVVRRERAMIDPLPSPSCPAAAFCERPALLSARFGAG